MKKIIFTENAPSPIGPYSQGVMMGDILYVSGQIPFNAAKGELMMNSIEEQTEQVMQNLKAVLSAADMNFDQVVKATIFLTDMNDFTKVNGVYGAYFQESTAPARECVQVAALPRGVNVEISVIAIK